MFAVKSVRQPVISGPTELKSTMQSKWLWCLELAPVPDDILRTG